jgi:NAD(P)H-dependent flavin oxidoreductase YrpB (nitropropane dioxygenase family)
MRALRNTERVMSNTAVEKVLEIERRAGETMIEDLVPYLAGRRGKGMLEEGDMETGTLAAGQCMGLIRDIPTCKELLDRIMDQAESIIREKYSQLS